MNRNVRLPSLSAHRGEAGFRCDGCQTGAALVVSLVILLLLSVIGISALTGTALESKMAGNVQEMNRAFQAAETGLDVAVGQGNAQESSTVTASVSNIGDYKASASYATSFNGFTKPPREAVKIFGNNSGRSAHFGTSSDGTAGIGAKVTLNQGWYQMVPDPSGSVLYE